MASGLDTSLLVMNPIEVQDLEKFIIEKTFMRPDLMQIHGIQTGVKMKEQIVFASQFGKTGIAADGSCSRKTSGANSILSQKYWDPAGIEDTMILCNKELNALFKAYFGKIAKYKDTYEIEGSDIEVFFSILLMEAMQNTIWRAAWFGDVNTAAAGAGTAGVVAAGDVKFYDYFDGLWAQIFDGVVAATVPRITIAENSTVTSKADQLALAAGKSVEYLRAVHTDADTRLRNADGAQFLVSREIFDNYREYLLDKGVVYDINILQNGLQALKFDGYDVVNMETIWSGESREDFVNNTTDAVYDLPHRIAFTVPENIPVGTLNEEDFTELEIWYEKKERENNIAYGFTLDSKLLEEYMTAVAY